MMQSSPLICRRARNLAGPPDPRPHLYLRRLFQTLSPQRPLLAVFFLEIFARDQHRQLRLPGRSLQVAVTLGRSIRSAHAAVHRNHSGSAAPRGLASPHLDHAAHRIMLGFFVVVTRAYLLHMNINCGCFATPEPIDLKKNPGGRRPLHPGRTHDLLRVRRKPQSASLDRAGEAQSGSPV